MNWLLACVFVQEGCDQFYISSLNDMICRRNLVQVTCKFCWPGHVLCPSCYGLTQLSLEQLRKCTVRTLICQSYLEQTSLCLSLACLEFHFSLESYCIKISILFQYFSLVPFMLDFEAIRNFPCPERLLVGRQMMQKFKRNHLCGEM